MLTASRSVDRKPPACPVFS